ncbi:HlyC/CorC family transporter [Methanoculleus sp. FWC-SCC1]|uniref:HlyC/CorC family transporter n=1 Tax=Methanoculleus frigidifontis TaxID=2584085 RepID=A0ABT8M653_9EURY|nr:hemolysin family protein [Methanoculleus sp. FWC-SCC1]MDN7023416.1 HlyC/CorC family transporter [Methanoculleus sp. FWC-SCC1]
MPIITNSIIILLLILANGIFSMAEFAIISSRSLRLQRQAEAGDAGAAAALEIIEDPTPFLSTVQVGITVIGILAGAFGGATIAGELAAVLAAYPAIAPYSDTIAIGIVVIGITYVTLVIGELVPKRAALANAERIASLVSRPMRLLSIITSPIVRFLSISTEAVLFLIGVRKPVEPQVTEEDIRVMIEQGTRAGVFEPAEQDMVERVFRLADRRVSALLTPRPEVTALDITDPEEENWRIMIESGHSSFPVYREDLDDILGIVSVQDVWARMASGAKPDLKAVLGQPLFVPESIPALKVLEQFKQSGTQFALVTDEYGSIQGVITLHDILEAIVGDIPSAEQPVEQEAVQRADGSWLLDGMLPIDEFRDIFGVGLLPGEGRGYYQTVGGFVMTYLERTPVSGDVFEWNHLRFEVMDMDGFRVDKVLVRPLPEPGEPGEE